MRLMIAGVVALLASQTAAAECPRGVATIVKLESWTVRNVEDSISQDHALTLSLINSAPTAFRMIDGAVWFSDALDRDIVSVKLPPDLTLDPGGKATSERFFRKGIVDRLLEAQPSDVQAIVCVEAVVYSDGSEERFD